MLAYRWLNEGKGGGIPLIALHGMFGRGEHLRGLVRRMDLARPVLLPDLRNHGASFWRREMDIPLMAGDLAALLDELAISRCMVLGHSMGGKVALHFSLVHPRKVDRIASLDMAPVTYPPRFAHLFEVLGTLELEKFQARGEVRRELASRLGDERLAGFLAQALVRDGRSWNWRFNLSSIRENGDRLRRFPPSPLHRQFRGPALFVHGDRSDYMREDYWPEIIRLFPAAKSRAIAGAGHWLHVDQPEETSLALRGFFISG